MRAKAIRRIVAVVAVLGTTAAIGGQERDARVRLTAAEVNAVRTEVASAGTSGLPAVTTRVARWGSVGALASDAAIPSLSRVSCTTGFTPLINAAAYHQRYDQ